MTSTTSSFYLDTRWTAEGGEHGRFLCRLTNLSDETPVNFRLGVTTVTLNLDPSQIINARRVRFDGSCHEFEPVRSMRLAAGESWAFEIGGLFRKPRHFVDGMSAAYLVFDDGRIATVHCSDLLLHDEGSLPSPSDMPEGILSLPIGILPWPNTCAVADFCPPPVALYAAPDTQVDQLRQMVEAARLGQRLFPEQIAPFALGPVQGGRPLCIEHDGSVASEGYRLEFTGHDVRLYSSHAQGTWYGLVTLAQLHHAAHAQPGRFLFPQSGAIDDAPRYGWRGCHLDVARQAYPVEQVRRFIDILAWNKLNVLHWHLTDDEGWRIEIKAFPELTAIGSRRGPSVRKTAQLGTGAETVSGSYSQAEISALVTHASGVGVSIMPEVDVPGHCAALIAALPDLRDPDEPADSYYSGQGFPNNALNPAVDTVYVTLETIFGEITALFPFDYFHIGGDEVAPTAWARSPLAQRLMEREKLETTQDLQAYFLRRIKALVRTLGKRMGGWNEVSHGGGVDREDTLLTIWERTRLGPELAGQGYDVVMSPGEAYYLDMARSDDFLAPGHHWAGTVTPEKTYSFEAAEGFPEELANRLKGVQAGIWGENLTSRERFNHMVFPRLGAVAEAGWTNPENKDWQRFCAQSKLMPRL